ncbi:hypothetical protein Hypma_000606 [Hypsizygus marmoreus]|uniref:Uncharacterized protein n=1 Tax=Hypsizygus marmoreus TaxID=39966 RepID=A0A369J845_HYPMA|nr:hypothetical protein Hypma_000606 [Hypsizygus marmoreus]
MKVICTCTICRVQTVTINGIEQPGQQVDSSTRLKHEKRDKQPVMPKKKRVSSPSSAPKPSRDSNLPKEINFSVAVIVKMVCILVGWLHIRAGVSRSTANTILRAIQLIFLTTIHLIEVALLLSGVNAKLSDIKIPRDVRTAYRLHYSLRETFHRRMNHPPAGFGATMGDIQDSPAWGDLYGFQQTPYHLVFGIYIDWFNPFTNKIAGKKVSCGAIVLYCLNLPPHLRYRPENTFIIGLTPPPHMPNMTTICHLLDPVITSVAKYSAAPGELVPTFHHPECIATQVKIAPLIADLEGSRKVAGFLAHSATMFCSFCFCTQDQLTNLDMQSWQLRNSAQVRAQAEEWLNITTKAGRHTLETATGVRWTPLHRLPYWDPVKHVVLGFMHNWLEGILQHHLRSLWAIGQEENESQLAEEAKRDEQWSEADVSDSADELDDLVEEAAENELIQHLPPPMSPSPSFSSSTTSSGTPTISSVASSALSGSSTPTASTPHPIPYAYDDDDDVDDNNDPDYVPVDIIPFSFTDAQLQAIRDCISNITLPTWAQRPPLILFWYIPAATDYHCQHFLCFYHLVTSTNIISAFKTSNAYADQYTHHYIQYRTAIQQLFPYCAEKPNHHYGMHNGALLKYWGPLASFSEFPGERMNGMLGSINTNNRLRDLDLTMICQMSRRAHVHALLHGEDDLKELADIIEPADASIHGMPVPIQPLKAAEALAKAPNLTEIEYTALLDYLRQTGWPYRAFDDFLHPLNALVLPPQAQRPLQIHRDNCTFSCISSHKGNSAIQFYNPFTQTRNTGFIETIWRLPLEGSMHTFIVVRLHQSLPAHEEQKAPFSHYPGFLTQIVDALPSKDLVIIEPIHIITHLTTFQRKAGTYGIGRETLVVCWAMNRLRR